MRTLIISFALATAALTGCAGLSERDQRIGSGAVIGGAAGGLLSGGSAAGVLGGAAIGGIGGAVVDQNARQRELEERQRQDRYRNDRRDRRGYYGRP